MMRTALIACLLLPSCSVFNADGARLQTPPNDSAALTPCPHPTEFLSIDDWEIMAGRLGDALLECEARRALAAATAQNLSGPQ